MQIHPLIREEQFKFMMEKINIITHKNLKYHLNLLIHCYFFSFKIEKIIATNNHLH
jgi:hypothetical protein